VNAFEKLKQHGLFYCGAISVVNNNDRVFIVKIEMCGLLDKALLFVIHRFPGDIN